MDLWFMGLYTCTPDVRATRQKMTEDAMFLKHEFNSQPAQSTTKMNVHKRMAKRQNPWLYNSTFKLKAKNIGKVIQEITTANKTKQSVNLTDIWRNTNATNKSKPCRDIVQTHRWR